MILVSSSLIIILRWLLHEDCCIEVVVNVHDVSGKGGLLR